MAPDPLEMQKLLAGMADRGADVAVVECEADGLADGRCRQAASIPSHHCNIITAPPCSSSKRLSWGMAYVLAAREQGGRCPKAGYTVAGMPADWTRLG